MYDPVIHKLNYSIYPCTSMHVHIHELREWSLISYPAVGHSVL